MPSAGDSSGASVKGSRKARTHERIVRSASRLFRKQGYVDTAVDTLMAEAGLTRGGFYAHFRNKADLFVEALHDSFAESRENLFGKGLEGLRGRAWVEAASARYLSWSHRTHRDHGCAVPSLAAEVARAPAFVRRSFTGDLDVIVEEVAGRLQSGPGDRDAARGRAWLLLSSWFGAMLIARAIPDRAVAEEVLRSVREAYLRLAVADE